MALLKLPDHRLSEFYIPTIAVDTNLSAATLVTAFRTVNGQCVQVYGVVNADPTTAAAFSFSVTLPFGMPVTAEHDIIGSCGARGWPNNGGIVRAGITSDVAIVRTAAGDAAVDVYFHFAYILNL